MTLKTIKITFKDEDGNGESVEQAAPFLCATASAALQSVIKHVYKLQPGFGTGRKVSSITIEESDHPVNDPEGAARRFMARAGLRVKDVCTSN